MAALPSTWAGCGDASAIKGYQYPTTKYNLEKAVRRAIKSNPNITLDSIARTVIVRRNPTDINDTSTMVISAYDYTGREREEILADYDALTKIKIKVGQIENVYVFRYLGTEQEWKHSGSSEIFISEARDKYGHALYQGENEHGEFTSKLAKDLTGLFEAEFISRLDKELDLKPIDD
jgi:hypothetical protein